MNSNWDVVIAGGGPAGFLAAIRCAEVYPQLRILILEKASQTLGKVLISGGGRCNVTHACFDIAKLVTFYPRGSNELRGACFQSPIRPRQSPNAYAEARQRLEWMCTLSRACWEWREIPRTDSSLRSEALRT